MRVFLCSLVLFSLGVMTTGVQASSQPMNGVAITHPELLLDASRIAFEQYKEEHTQDYCVQSGVGLLVPNNVSDRALVRACALLQSAKPPAESDAPVSDDVTSIVDSYYLMQEKIANAEVGLEIGSSGKVACYWYGLGFICVF